MGSREKQRARELELISDNENLRRTNATLEATILALKSAIDALGSQLEAQRKAFEDQQKALEQTLAKLDSLQRRFLGKKSEKNTKVPSPEAEARAKKREKHDPAETKQKRQSNAKKRAAVETERVFHPVPQDQRMNSRCHRLTPDLRAA